MSGAVTINGIPSTRQFDAAIFDMDGVVTETATVHAAAWKRMFDEFLTRQAQGNSAVYREFSNTHDYRAHVDGRPRYEGVETFLKSRGIHLPLGNPEDDPTAETVCGLGNRKNELFNQIIAAAGAMVFPNTIALIEQLQRGGVKVGLATSSKNSGLILSKTRTEHLFSTIVDGVVSERLGLKGKPHADIFVTACRNLGVPPTRSIVVEDAVSGVKAGAAGGFALILGVAREGNAEELLRNGADMVVGDLGEVTVEEINRRIRQKRSAG